MPQPITCGEATIRLLEKYGVSTVFGIPGVHTLDLCRGLDKGGVNHIQSRNEQGAGFMAEGWARATGEVGVALVISGPGVTNATTALGQCYADSLPMLLISAEAASNTIGKGWGVLHEVTEQKKATEPLTGYSATVYRAADVPQVMARAFTVLKSGRPRPVHISIPTDVQAELVQEEWEPIVPAPRPPAPASQIAQAAELLKAAKTPLIMVGGGAAEAGADLVQIAETIGAIVVASTAGKGIVADNHPLSLSASTVRPEVQAFLGEADVILAVGTELAETDSFIERMELSGKIIRVDIDPIKITDVYPADIGIVADAALFTEALASRLDGHVTQHGDAARARVTDLRAQISRNLTGPEQQHAALLRGLKAVAPENTVWSGDSCQLVYTGAFAMPMQHPRKWFYPAGYCALGNALPNGIGAKMARPSDPVVVLAGDGGFMFTMPELVTAAELGMSLPIIIWENGGLKQIQDDMDRVSCIRVGVEGINPDFVMLAKACHCHGVDVATVEDARDALIKALEADRPTVIVFHEIMNGG